MEMEVNNGSGHDDDDMAIAEKYDAATTIAYANEEIREILHRMEGSLQIANKVEQSTMIQAFKNLYPQVTSQEFFEMGAHKDVMPQCNEIKVSREITIARYLVRFPQSYLCCSLHSNIISLSLLSLTVFSCLVSE